MANGAFGIGNGEQNNPFIIEDVQDLSAIRSHQTNSRTYYYKLNCHLNLKDVDWKPIKNFHGVFDGNAKTITNLTINDASADDLGLFANLQTNARIYNLGLINVKINGNDRIGGLAGKIDSDNVEVYNISVQGELTGHDYIGGLIGISRSRSTTYIHDIISDVKVTGNISVGGLAGEFTSYSDNETTRSKFQRAFFFNSVEGVDAPSTNPTFGIRDTNALYEDLYYDKDKIAVDYPDTTGIGKSKEFFYTTENFPNFAVSTILDDYYPHKQYTFTFSNGNYPTMCFQNRKFILFSINNELYKYDDSTKEFVKLDTPSKLTYEFFFKNGVKDISDIPISTLKKALRENKQNLKLLVLREYNNNNNNKLEILTDEPVSNLTIGLTTHSQRTIEKDYNPITMEMDYETIKKAEATEFPLIVYSEWENERNEELNKKVYVRSSKTSANTNPFTLRAQYNNDDGNSSSVKGSGFQDARTIQVEGNGHAEVKNFEQTTKVEFNKTVDWDKSKLKPQVKFDTRIEKQSVKTNITYTLYNTIVNEKRGIHVEAHGENKSRYLISVNNGKDWLSYKSSNNTWVKKELKNIINDGVTLKDLASRTVMNALPTNYKSKIKIASAISVEAFNDSYNIKGLNIEFEPNNGPDVENFLSKKKNDYVVITGKFVDKENDDLFYRLLTKSQIETDYHQIYPASDSGWLQSKNEKEFEFKIPLSKFRNGSNMIKLITKDTRGEISEKTIDMTLIEGTPEIKINSNNQFYANITLSHTMNKKVRFKILINGTQKAPYTEGQWSEWHETVEPFTFDYTWNTSDVLNGLPNEIQILVQDEMQTETFATFNIIGEYKALLFKDENNFYYSTDTGEVLQQLDFGTVIGGINTDDYTVTLENKTGLSMNDIIIFPDSDTQEDKAKIKLSHTGTDSTEGFISSSESFTIHNYNSLGTEIGSPKVYDNAIKVPYVLDNNDTYKFHVRIESTQDVPSYRHKIFRVLATGTPIDTTLVTINLPANEYVTKYNNSKLLDSLYEKEGEGLFELRIKDIPDTCGLNGKSIFVIGDYVYTWDNGRITEEEFMKNPIDIATKKANITEYSTNNSNYSIFSVSWLDTLFTQYYGDTLSNLVNKGNVSYTRRLRENEYYDGHIAWLKDNANNPNITFTLNRKIVQK